jgi:hypothetical protein
MRPNEREELLAMFRLIETAKDAIERFERGEMNIRDAIQQIVAATAWVRAA